MSNPYFYVVRHIPTGIKYAGVSCGKTSNPETFMTAKGYCTSSDDVLALIGSEGIGAFEIEELLVGKMVATPICLHVADFETFFLESNDCAADPMWFNKHNNQGINFASDAYKEKSRKTMLLKYGVENAMHIPEVKQKLAAAMAGNNYGCKPRSAETKARMSAYQKGRTKTDQHRANLSAAKIGKLPDAATRKKMSEVRSGKPRPQAWHDKMAAYRESIAHVSHCCPHCGLTTTSKALYIRWHNDNCKQKATA